jgi:uncharacterized protein
MQYNVAQLLKEPTGATRKVGVDGELNVSGSLTADCQGSVEFVRTHQGLLVRGMVDAWVTTTCSRCLGEFASLSLLDVEEEYFPLVDVSTGRRLELPWDYEGTIIDATHILDLTELLRQCTLASQPIKPLCRPNCQGLCQECGVDLNRENCVCGGAAIDPRWSALAALLNQSET